MIINVFDSKMASYIILNPFSNSNNVYIFGDITRGKKIRLGKDHSPPIICDVYIENIILTHRYIVDGIVTFNPDEPYYVCHTGEVYNYIVCGNRLNYTQLFMNLLFAGEYDNAYYIYARYFRYTLKNNDSAIKCYKAVIASHNQYFPISMIECADLLKTTSRNTNAWISLYNLICYYNCELSVMAAETLGSYYMSLPKKTIHNYLLAEKYFNIVANELPSKKIADNLIAIGLYLCNNSIDRTHYIRCYKAAVKTGFARPDIIKIVEEYSAIKNAPTTNSIATKIANTANIRKQAAFAATAGVGATAGAGAPAASYAASGVSGYKRKTPNTDNKNPKSTADAIRLLDKYMSRM